MSNSLVSALELHDISHAYENLLAVDHASIHVNEGEVICLLGPSGCGKSTILRLAAGLETLQRGRVVMQGRQVADGATRSSLPPERRGVGLVFQDFALFPHLSVERNVGFGLGSLSASERSGRVEELLGTVGLGGLGRKFPHELSGGQQQRVALARALAPRPELVLLDEPCAGVNPSLVGGISTLLKDLNRNPASGKKSSFVVIEHNMDFVMDLCHRIMVMVEGKVMAIGTPAEIRANKQVLDAYLGGST